MLTALLSLVLAPRIKGSGWVVFYDDGVSVADFKAHASKLDTISVQWLECSADGTVHRAADVKSDQLAGVRKLANQKGVTILGMLQNPNFDPTPVERIMSSPDKMRAHVRAIVREVEKDRLDGLDLDYESLKAGDRDHFSEFVHVLAEELHTSQKLLAIAVHPKAAEPGTWDGPQAQDWAKLGKVVDRFRVMCYDEHWATSEAGPVADIAWVRSIMALAVSEVAPRKIEIGVPGYGYDWVGKKGTDLTFSQFTALPGSKRALRDPASQELVLSHGNSTAYFCDATSESGKVALARKIGVRGVCLWRLGAEDPAWWNLFR